MGPVIKVQGVTLEELARQTPSLPLYRSFGRSYLHFQMKPKELLSKKIMSSLPEGALGLKEKQSTV